MKTLFKEYFYPSDADIKDVWDNSLIVFDTCSLLNLYRYTEKTRESFIKILESYKERLWIPYQVAMEFLQEKKEVIKSQEKAYDEINKELDDAINKLEKAFNKYKKHVVINTELFKTKTRKSIETIKSELQDTRSKLPQYDKKDDLLETIITVFENKVGTDFCETELNKLYKEGESRYKEEIPPGYKDKKQKKSLDNRHLYGDLIIWKQIIKKASDDKCNIIFVTDDQKEDWWLIENGKTISPRLELYREFFTETEQQRLLIYKADSFLHYSNQYLKDSPNKIDESSIQEVKTLPPLTEHVPTYKDFYKKIKDLKDKYGIDIYENLTPTLDELLKDKKYSYSDIKGDYKNLLKFINDKQIAEDDFIKKAIEYIRDKDSDDFINTINKDDYLRTYIMKNIQHKYMK